MAITKADLVEKVTEKVGFSKKDSGGIVDAIFEVMRESLERGESVKISGFGKFTVRQKKARMGRNPQTGQTLEISARRVMGFKPSHVLKRLLNTP